MFFFFYKPDTSTAQIRMLDKHWVVYFLVTTWLEQTFPSKNLQFYLLPSRTFFICGLRKKYKKTFNVSFHLFWFPRAWSDNAWILKLTKVCASPVRLKECWSIKLDYEKTLYSFPAILKFPFSSPNKSRPKNCIEFYKRDTYATQIGMLIDIFKAPIHHCFEQTFFMKELQSYLLPNRAFSICGLRKMYKKNSNVSFHSF